METSAQPADGGRSYGGKSAGERLAQQRQQFLDAGLELFGTIGFRATTVRLLCKQAGLIDRYFYRNFDTTEDLLAEVYTALMDRIEAQVLNALATTPAAAGRDALVKACMDAFFTAIEDRRVARVGWLEVLGVSPRIDAVYVARTQRFAQLLLDLGKRIFDTHLPRTLETEIVAIAAVGGVSQCAMQWLLSDYKASRRTVVAAASKIIRGLAYVLAEEAEQRQSSRARSRRR